MCATVESAGYLTGRGDIVNEREDRRSHGQSVRRVGDSEPEPRAAAGEDPAGAHGDGDAGQDGSAVRDVAGRSASDPEPGREASGDIERLSEGEGELLDEEQDEVLLEQALLYMQKHWSGMLPEPAVFAQYPPEVQERIMRWNDSWTVDESDRQDRLVNAEIQSAGRGQGWAIFLFLLMIVLAFVLFLRGNNVGGGVLIGVPAVAFLINLARGSTRRLGPGADAKE